MATTKGKRVRAAREGDGGRGMRRVGVNELALIVLAVVVVAIAPIFLLAKSIDGDEWMKGGAGIVGAVLTALGAIWRIYVSGVSAGSAADSPSVNLDGGDSTDATEGVGKESGG